MPGFKHHEAQQTIEELFPVVDDRATALAASPKALLAMCFSFRARSLQASAACNLVTRKVDAFMGMLSVLRAGTARVRDMGLDVVHVCLSTLVKHNATNV